MKTSNRIPFQQWEKDFIYLTYPDNDTKEIGKILNRSPNVIQVYASSKKIKKEKKILVQPGDMFGFLEIIEQSKSKNKERRWKCKCVCGKFSECGTNTLTSGHSTSCGCKRIESITHSFKNITGTWYHSVAKSAKVRGFEFNLSKEFLQDLLEKQSFKCKLSGLPIKIYNGRNCQKYYYETTASLDRIDNIKGYDEDNVQFLHKHINYMKWTHNEDYFITLCKKVSENNESININN